MATMHSLFFGILFTAICGNLDAIHHTVSTEVTFRQEYKNNPVRVRIIEIAAAEIGVREATGNNDGKRVEEYLRYTGLDKGHAWCAAFISWCYAQVGLTEPRNPWSPALFPNARTYCRGAACAGAANIKRIRPADVFGIYGHSAKRINHVGLVLGTAGKYLLTIEGNVENRVLSKRRHLSTIYALADWITNE